MIITEAKYIDSAYLPSQLLDGAYPEISFIGRSNVGKSSLINTLTGRKRLAYISKKPGKTRTINYFLINRSIHFVDLPGYGYAQVSKNMQRDWEQLVTTYLSSSRMLKLSLLIIDARYGPKHTDIEVLNMLQAYKRPVLIVATKFDKVKNKDRHKRKKEMRRDLGLTDKEALISFSAVTGEGKEEILEVIWTNI